MFDRRQIFKFDSITLVRSLKILHCFLYFIHNKKQDMHFVPLNSCCLRWKLVAVVCYSFMEANLIFFLLWKYQNQNEIWLSQHVFLNLSQSAEEIRSLHFTGSCWRIDSGLAMRASSLSVEHWNVNPNLVLIAALQVWIWEAGTVIAFVVVLRCTAAADKYYTALCRCMCKFALSLAWRCQCWELLCRMELVQMCFEKAQTKCLSEHGKKIISFFLEIIV